MMRLGTNYLCSSPIARLVFWAIGRRPKPSDGVGSEQLALDRMHKANDQLEIAHTMILDSVGGQGCQAFRNAHAEHAKTTVGYPHRSIIHDWSLGRRVCIAAIISWHTFIVYAASAIYIIGIPGVMLEFGVSEKEALLGLSLYVLAYGLGPMLWAPLSEIHFIGRSPIYALTFVAFVVFSILAATAKSWSALLALRFIQAFFGSPCLAIGGASMHDLFPDMTVPYSLVFWVAAAYCGPALGPLMASSLVPEKGWRSGMWEIVWIAAPTIILMATLPETHEPSVKAQKAEYICQTSERTGTKCAQGNSGALRLIVRTLRDAVVTPVRITILDPAIAVANLYTAFIYGTYYTFFDAIPRVYIERYTFSIAQLGLVFLCIFVACILGGSTYSLYIYQAEKQDGRDYVANHEDCLRPALVASFLPPIGLFIFGWTSNGHICWVLSVLGITLYATGMFVVLQCLAIYLPRIYPDYSASLFAGNDLCRSLVATAAIHVSIPLYSSLGVRRGVSILGAISVLGIPGIWFMFWRGGSLRAKSLFVRTSRHQIIS